MRLTRLPSRPITRLVNTPCSQTFRGISSQELDETKGERQRVVILGSGWAGYNFSRHLDPTKFQPVVVSPRSYFVFTPLLASTAVGTLEFRSTLESVRERNSSVQFFQGWADDISFYRKKIWVEESAVNRANSLALTGEAGSAATKEKGKIFELDYDKLVVAVGCYSQTFGTKGVRENAFFLKDIGDARKIRKRILDCFETAALPSSSIALRKQILNFAIVGGGPTGVEFAAELFDLCREDLKRLYPEVVKHVQISIYDVSPKILPMFDKSLSDYALRNFGRDGIQVKTRRTIVELCKGLPSSTEGDSAGCFTLKTKEDGDVGVGMCVWSTGLMMNPFVTKALDICYTYPEKSAIINSATVDASEIEWNLKRSVKTGGLMVDDHFQVKLVPQGDSSDVEAVMKDVFAIGDVCVMESGILPATAQVANQEAKWLATRLNAGDVDQQRFTFKNLGVMTYLGNWKAIMQTGGNTEIRGWLAWFIWRGAYLTQTISWRNKLTIPFYWTINAIFGRDISRF